VTASSLVSDIRYAIRSRHYSIRTERAYLYWIREFVRHHGMRHPKELGSAEVGRFLSHLAVRKGVAPNTQKVALNALVFLYVQVLGQKQFEISGFRRSDKSPRLPVVLTRTELDSIFERLDRVPRLCAQIMYGSGLRVMEVVRLRVHDLDFDRLSILVRHGKGGKQRLTILAESLLPEIRHQLDRARYYFDEDLAQADWPGVYLPNALAAKYRQAPREWGWQYLFPAAARRPDPRSGLRRRHHITERTVQRAFASALRSAGIAKPASCHSLCHSFATHSLLIFWSAVQTSAPCRSSSDTQPFEQPRSIPM